MDGNLTPDTRISITAPRLTPAAVKAAEEAVEAALNVLENTETTLQHWAYFNEFRALFGHIRKKQGQTASNMTLEEFANALALIVGDAGEAAAEINQHRTKKKSSHIDVEALTEQIQSVADVALKAASDVMQHEASTGRMEPSALSTHKR